MAIGSPDPELDSDSNWKESSIGGNRFDSLLLRLALGFRPDGTRLFRCRAACVSVCSAAARVFLAQAVAFSSIPPGQRHCLLAFLIDSQEIKFRSLMFFFLQIICM